MKENINKQQILILRYVKLKHSILTINAKTRPSPRPTTEKVLPNDRYTLRLYMDTYSTSW